MRERARDLLDLLRNPDRIRAERLKARELKEQYSGHGPSSYFKSSESSRDLGPVSSGADEWGDGGGAGSRGRGGSGGRGEGRDLNDDWAAGYERSPSPSPPPSRGRPSHSRTSSVGSDRIDFDTGRGGYSERLSAFQEQEKREAVLAATRGRWVEVTHVGRRLVLETLLSVLSSRWRLAFHACGLALARAAHFDTTCRRP